MNPTRLNIIESGTGILLEKGYNGAGLAEILTDAGVPKGSFYHFFKNKQDFGKEVLVHYSNQFIPTLQTCLIDSDKPPLDRIKLFFEKMANHFDSEKECKGGCLVGNLAQELADVNEDFRLQINLIMKTWSHYFETCLQEALNKGDLPKDTDVAELADVILTSWEGALMKMKVEGAVTPLKRFSRVFFKLLSNNRH